MKFTFIIFSKG